MASVPVLGRMAAAALLFVVAAAPVYAHGSLPPTHLGRADKLEIGMPDSNLSVDPAMASDAANVEFADLLYSGLVRLGARYQVVAADAARYTLSRDGETYTFYLRRNLHFSNGDPIVAEDFAFSIQRSLSPSLKSPAAPTYLLDIQGAEKYLAGKARRVSGIKVLNRYVLQITTRWPAPYFLLELTYPTSFALDSARLRKLGPVDDFSWYSHPISSGPYRLYQWTSDNTILLVANKHAPSPPATPRVVISLTSLPATGLYSYLSRSVDVATLPSFAGSLLPKPGIHQVRMLAIDGIYMNLRRVPFSSLAFRRALAMSINRSDDVGKSFHAAATPFSGYVPPGEDGFDPQLKAPPYDAAEARTQLSSVHPRPRGITLSYATDDPSQYWLARAIARDWQRNLHIGVTLQGLTLNTLYVKAQAGQLPLYIFGWSADYPSPHDWLALQWEPDALDNNVHYHNPQFDRLVEAGDATWDPKRRDILYRQAQQVLADDVAWIPLYVPHQLDYIRPTVQNVTATGYGVIPRDGSWGWVWKTGR